MTKAYGAQHTPTEIRVKTQDRCLEIDFDDGESYVIPAELLRVESPSAEVQGHSPDQKQTIGGKQDVGIIGVDPVGNYAIRIRFDDLHDTGIFTWDLLYTMGKDQDALWQSYLANLDADGLSRAP